MKYSNKPVARFGDMAIMNPKTAIGSSSLRRSHSRCKAGRLLGGIFQYSRCESPCLTTASAAPTLPPRIVMFGLKRFMDRFVVRKQVSRRPQAVGTLLVEDLPDYRFSPHVTNLDLSPDQVWNICKLDTTSF
jgi:hypothetical protein